MFQESPISSILGIAITSIFMISPVLLSSEADTVRKEIEGWEGFYSLERIDRKWLDSHNIPLRPEVIHRVKHRVVKFVVASSERKVSRDKWNSLRNEFCSRENTKKWNRELCRSLEKGKIVDDSVTYRHYGNCSGFLLSDSLVISASHCAYSLLRDSLRRKLSRIVIPDSFGKPGKRLSIKSIKMGKTDYEHHWIAVEEENPVDAVSLSVDEVDLEQWKIGDVPSEGEIVFTVGYPRVLYRNPEDCAKKGYTLVYGTPTVSFGRVAERNEEGLPLCSVDGNQEHWQLTDNCETAEIEVNGRKTWKGVILSSPFLTTTDIMNGYSGAPVFDSEGRLVGITNTVISSVNPQTTYSPETRSVVTPIRVALEKLQ